MKGLCIAIAMAVIAFCAFFFPQQAPVIIHWFNGLGLLAPVFFLILYCVATLFFLPTMVLTLVGGALFGPFLGTLFNLAGATLGAGLAFIISRYWVCDWFHRKQNKNIGKLIRGVEQKGWQFVALLRIVPIIPFNLVNYGLGLTRIKFSHYLITTLIFLVPVEIVTTYCGHAGMGFIVNASVIYKYLFMALLLLLSLIYLTNRVIKQKKITSDCKAAH